MRTVTAICCASIAGACVAFVLLAVFVETPILAIPIMAGFLAAVLLACAWAMARQANTPILLPGTIFVLFTGAFYWLLSSSW
jgi:hypothetical protein